MQNKTNGSAIEANIGQVVKFKSLFAHERTYYFIITNKNHQIYQGIYLNGPFSGIQDAFDIYTPFRYWKLVTVGGE
jgi:hypothetical protein